MTLATIENMIRYADVPGILAWSPQTGEEYSANSSDYFAAAPGWTMRDAVGDPMELVVRVCAMQDVAEV